MAYVGPIGGTAYLSINGQMAELRGNLTITPSTEDAEMVVGQDGPHGYITKKVAPNIEAELSDWGGFSIQAIAAIRGATITAELANGKTYTLIGAITVGAPKLETMDGKLQLKWEGISCREILSS